MKRIVQKFGGTSVADITRIKAVAEQVKQERDRGNQVAVVLSAMAGTTNQLVAWARDLGPIHDAREYDTILSTGEQVSVGLLAIALQNIGVDARSWLGWQMPFKTDDLHGAAHIEEIDTKQIEQRLEQGQVAVIAGFQGIAEDQRITTLGRGGSDSSAVALAAALKADRCDIYTDVDGVYTADPRIMPRARKLDKITFEEMLEMASAGAKILQTRSVAIAMRHHVKLQVLSSFSNETGTFVVDEDKDMETQKISGIAYSRDEAKVTLVGLSDQPGIAATIFKNLAEQHINVDMIVQSASPDSAYTDLTFSVAAIDVEKAVACMKKNQADLKYQNIVYALDITKVSVIGTAMRSQSGIAKTMFSVLAEKGINLHVISTSEIKISVLIDADYTELAVRSLHDAFGLETA